MKEKDEYKEGTVNGIKFNNREKRSNGISTKTLIKIGIFCVVLLVVFLIFYFIVKSTISFNGVYYETPSEDEVIEVVVDDPKDEGVQEQVNLKLKGDLVIELEQGKEWEEPGFIATSDIAGDISDYVKVTGEVNTEKQGTYEIVYELEYKVITPKLTRLVKVIESKDNDKEDTSSGSTTGSGSLSSGGSTTKPNPPVAKPSTITLSLVGNDTIYLVTGSTYYDEGASAVDNLGNNVSNKVSKSGSVNTDVAGTYKITYSITNYDGQVLSVVRNVVVQAMNISLNSEISGSKVNINVSTNVDNFSYILLPNGSKTTNSNCTYPVSKNGVYEFIVYNSNDNYRKATITINNVPTLPKVTCTISNTSGKSVITMSTSSSSLIDHYVYSGQTFSSQLALPRKIPSGSTINVGVVYKDGSTRGVACTSP